MVQIKEQNTRIQGFFNVNMYVFTLIVINVLSCNNHIESSSIDKQLNHIDTAKNIKVNTSEENLISHSKTHFEGDTILFKIENPNVKLYLERIGNEYDLLEFKDLPELSVLEDKELIMSALNNLQYIRLSKPMSTTYYLKLTLKEGDKIIFSAGLKTYHEFEAFIISNQGLCPIIGNTPISKYFKFFKEVKKIE